MELYHSQHNLVQYSFFLKRVEDYFKFFVRIPSKKKHITEEKASRESRRKKNIYIRMNFYPKHGSAICIGKKHIWRENVIKTLDSFWTFSLPPPALGSLVLLPGSLILKMAPYCSLLLVYNFLLGKLRVIPAALNLCQVLIGPHTE